MKTQVKFCGITNPTDAHKAAELGADAIGLIFHPPSPVAIDLPTAKAITAALPPFLTTVALFVNAPVDQIRRTIDEITPHCLQFHGDPEIETAAHCQQFNLPYIKACHIRTPADLTAVATAHPAALALLLDTHRPGQYGGTGQTFDWTLIPDQSPRPLIIAGGLTPENIGALIRQKRPIAVDTSGGIAKQNDKRQKDWDKMRSFLKQTNP